MLTLQLDDEDDEDDDDNVDLPGDFVYVTEASAILPLVPTVDLALGLTCVVRFESQSGYFTLGKVDLECAYFQVFSLIAACAI